MLGLGYFVDCGVAICPALQLITSDSLKDCFYGFLLWRCLCLESSLASREMKFVSLCSVLQKLELFSILSWLNSGHIVTQWLDSMKNSLGQECIVTTTKKN